MTMTNMRECAPHSIVGLEESLGLKDFPNLTEKSCELGEIKVQRTAKNPQSKATLSSSNLSLIQLSGEHELQLLFCGEHV